MESALQQAISAIGNQVRAVKPLAKMKLSGKNPYINKLPARLEQRHQLVQEGWTPVGTTGGYFKRNQELGPVTSFMNRDKIPENKLKALEAGSVEGKKSKAYWDARRAESMDKRPMATPTPTAAEQAAKQVQGDFSPPPGFENFIEMATPILEKYEIPLALAAAQYAAETDRGKRIVGQNNWYNLGAYDSDVYNAFDYPTPEAGVEAYARLLAEDPRYAEAYEMRQNPVKMLRELAPTYASRPDYADFVMSTPEWRQYYNNQ